MKRAKSILAIIVFLSFATWIFYEYGLYVGRAECIKLKEIAV
jgi:hypothetical protein